MELREEIEKIISLFYNDIQDILNELKITKGYVNEADLKDYPVLMRYTKIFIKNDKNLNDCDKIFVVT